MKSSAHKAVAIVGVGAVLPDAPNASTFWQNIKSGRYSITDVPRERWNPELYYDPDPKVPDKTYSKIGGWVRDFEWDPLKWKLPIPPRVSASMDLAQKWAIIATREALVGRPRMPKSSVATWTKTALESSENSFQLTPPLSRKRITGTSKRAQASRSRVRVASFAICVHYAYTYGNANES